MAKWLAKPAVWLTVILSVFGLFAMAACDKDTPEPDEGGCTKLGAACRQSSKCCEGLTCTDGICDARVPCAPVGGRCGSGRSCCGVAICREVSPGNRVCDGGGCVNRGGGCGNGLTCCGTLLCRSNICTD